MKVGIDRKTTIALMDYGNVHLGTKIQYIPDTKIPFPTCFAGPDMIGKFYLDDPYF